MIKRSKWLSVCISLAAILSMLLVGVTAARAAVPGKSHSAHSPKACKPVKAKGKIIFSDWQFPDTFNAYQGGGLAVTGENANLVFEGLFAVNNKATMIPIMATNIPSLKNHQISNGGKTYIVHLKKNLKWSDGQPITSADWKFGWQIDSQKVTGPACLGSCDVIRSIDTRDKYTIVFNLKHVYSPFLSYGLPDFWPLTWKAHGGWSKGNVSEAANRLAQDEKFDFKDAQYPTNGAYQVAEWVQDNRIVYKPMKLYRNLSCGAAISQAIFAFYSSKPGMIAGAAARETDITTDYTAADLPDLRKHTDAYHLTVIPGFFFEHLEFNVDKTYQGKTNPLGNLKVRQALALALDKVGMVRSALGLSSADAKAIVAYTALVNTKTLKQPFANKKLTGQWDPLQKKYVPSGSGKALADAKKLISQTPFKGGFSLDFWTTQGNPVREAQAAFIQSQWANLGVKVNQNRTTATKLFAGWDKDGVIAKGNFQVAMFAFIGSPDPDSYRFRWETKFIERRQSQHPCAPCGNNSGIDSKVINKAMDGAAASLSSKVRARDYAIAQVQINQNAYWVPLYYRVVVTTDDGKVKNFSANPTSAGPTWNASKWGLKG